jgi:hypothetical protein
MLEMKEFENGMTVRELRKVSRDWPLYNSHTGEECEVWICWNGLSGQVKTVCPLSSRNDDGHISADLLLET